MWLLVALAAGPLAMTLAAAPARAAQLLYRCEAGEAPVRWQDEPCAAGERQRTLDVDPAMAQARAQPQPVASVPKKPRRAPRPASGWAARSRAEIAARERREAACAEARALARERSDAQGRRVSVHTIRAREREAREVCKR